MRIGKLEIRFGGKRAEQRSFYPETGSIYASSGDQVPEGANPTAVACENLIVNTLSTIPLHLIAYIKGGGQVLASFHPLFKLIEDPSYEESSSLFWSTMIRHMLAGNAFLYKNRDADGVPISLSIIDRSKVIVSRDPLTHEKLFTIEGVKHTSYDVIHIPYPGIGYNGTLGRSPRSVASPPLIALNNLLLDYIRHNFDNNIGHRILFELGDTYKNQALEDVYKAVVPFINKYLTGPMNAGKPGLAPKDTKIHDTNQNVSAHDELSSLLKFLESRIAACYGIPSEMIDGTNPYNSLELREANFLERTIRPLGEHIEDALRKGLVSPADTNIDLSYDYDAAVQTDTKSRITIACQLFAGGLLSLDEARARAGYPAIGGDLGDLHVAPTGNPPPLTEDWLKAKLEELEAGKRSAPRDIDGQLQSRMVPLDDRFMRSIERLITESKKTAISP